MYKYTHPQNPSVTGTVDEAMYLKMKADLVFAGYRWEKLKEAQVEPDPQITPPEKEKFKHPPLSKPWKDFDKTIVKSED